jgi:hypothetical protein
MGVFNWFRRRGTLTKVVIIVGILLLLFIAFTIPVGIIGAIILGVAILIQRGVEKRKKPMIDRLKDLQKHKLYNKLDDNVKATVGRIIGDLKELKTKKEVEQYKKDNTKTVIFLEKFLDAFELNDNFIKDMKDLGSDPVDRAIFDAFNNKIKNELSKLLSIKTIDDVKNYKKVIMKTHSQLKKAKRDKIKYIRENVLDDRLAGWIKLCLDNIENIKKNGELPDGMSRNMGKMKLKVARIKDPKIKKLLKVIFKDIGKDIEYINTLEKKEKDIAAWTSIINSMKSIKSELFGQ